MRELAPTPEQAPAMTLQLFQHWLTNQTVNGFTVAARPQMQQTLLDIWPKTPTGELDLDQSPLRLQAIVNRIDCATWRRGTPARDASSSACNAVTFGFPPELHGDPRVPPAGAQTQDDVMDWANRWHALSSHPFPSEEYNAALEADHQALHRARQTPADGVNGSALVELRTNEIALSPFGEWELREFALSSTTRVLRRDHGQGDARSELQRHATRSPTSSTRTPPRSRPSSRAPTVTRCPSSSTGRASWAARSSTTCIDWNAPGINDPDARFHMSLNTCNGCHGPETNTELPDGLPALPRPGVAALALPHRARPSSIPSPVRPARSTIWGAAGPT